MPVDRRISIHSLRVEGDLNNVQTPPPRRTISIHSLRVEGDRASPLQPCERRQISIHSLRVEGDVLPTGVVSNILSFQSTPSAWRETRSGAISMSEKEFQSTPSAWRETLTTPDRRREWTYFNPLPPRGGRPKALTRAWKGCAISIHSLRVEGDRCHDHACGEATNFNPLPPRGGRRCKITIVQTAGIFQSTPSAWRETGDTVKQTGAVGNFNPLPPRGGRHDDVDCPTVSGRISIHSLRVEGDAAMTTLVERQRISIHSLRVEGDWTAPAFINTSGISIHSLRVEGDTLCTYPSAAQENFNPLPPRGGRLVGVKPFLHQIKHFNPLPPRGGRQNGVKKRANYNKFQSTPSAWRETTAVSIWRQSRTNFNPLPPRGGRQAARQSLAGITDISIHSLRVEGDEHAEQALRRQAISIHSLRVEGDLRQCIAQSHQNFRFQSTPSAWRETNDDFGVLQVVDISIHSLRVEGDCSRWANSSSGFFISIHSLRVEGDADRQGCPSPSTNHFNPLPPRGGRPDAARGGSGLRYFNPLPPRGGRLGDTVKQTGAVGNFNPLPPRGGRQRQREREEAESAISIHSLRVEGDASTASIASKTPGFQSTPSAWRETIGCGQQDCRPYPISIHSLRVEGDCAAHQKRHGRRYFNPLPPRGGRPWIDGHYTQTSTISIHSLRVEGDSRCGYVRCILGISIHSLRVEGDHGHTPR